MATSVEWVPETGCTEQCQVHEGCIVKFYCPSHDVFACGNCLVETHATCDTEYIPDVAKDYEEGEEFMKFKDSIKIFETNLSTLGEDDIENEIANVREYREEINRYLDEKEEEAISKLRKIQQENRKLENVHTRDCSDCAAMEDEINQLKQTVDEKKQSHIEMFMSVKREMQHLSVLTARLAICEEKQKVPSYVFQRNSEFLNLMKMKTNCIGAVLSAKDACNIATPSDDQSASTDATLDVERAEETSSELARTEFNRCIFLSGKLTRYAEIIVKSSSSPGNCSITGIDYLCMNKLIIADGYHKCVTLVDTKQRQILKRLDLPSKPFDIATLSDDKAAVSLPFDKSIQIVAVYHPFNALYTANTIKVNGECYGVAYRRDKLVVSYLNPAKLEIMDIDGTVINCINASQNDQRILEWPYYVTITDDVISADGEISEAIYVSDSYKKTVTKFSLTGEILFTYSGLVNFVNFEGTVVPRGICPAGRGNILVCCSYTDENEIHLVSREGKKIRVSMDKDRSFRYHLQAMCYSPDMENVFLSMCGETYKDSHYDRVSVYKVGV